MDGPHNGNGCYATWSQTMRRAIIRQPYVYTKTFLCGTNHGFPGLRSLFPIARDY